MISLNTSKEKQYWNKFLKTGHIEDYILYKAISKRENKNETNSKKQWGNNKNQGL